PRQLAGQGYRRSREALHGQDQRALVRSRLDLPVRSRDDLQGSARADGVDRSQEARRDDAQDRPQGRPREVLPGWPRQVRRAWPPRRRGALHRAVAERPAGRGASGEHRGGESGLAEAHVTARRPPMTRALRLALLLTLALATPVAAQAPVEIAFWYGVGGQLQKVIESQADKFNASHPG